MYLRVSLLIPLTMRCLPVTCSHNASLLTLSFIPYGVTKTLWQSVRCCQSNADTDSDTPLQPARMKGAFLIFPQRPFFF